MPEGDKFVSFVSRRQQAQQKLQIGVTAAQLAKAERLSLPARQIPISPPLGSSSKLGQSKKVIKNLSTVRLFLIMNKLST